MKRLRKEHGKGLKYYACGEYGTETNRPHYHAIIFNLPQLWLLDPNYLESTWKHGRIHIGDANIKTIHYTLKYMMKDQAENNDQGREKTFSLMSKGLGLSYLTPQMRAYIKNQQTGTVTMPGGTIQVMPRYYKDKSLTQVEKWLIQRQQQQLQQEKQETQDMRQVYMEYHDKYRKHNKKNQQRGKL